MPSSSHSPKLDKMHAGVGVDLGTLSLHRCVTPEDLNLSGEEYARWANGKFREYFSEATPPSCLDPGKYEDENWFYEIMPLLFGRGRIIWTDGEDVDAFW